METERDTLEETTEIGTGIGVAREIGEGTMIGTEGHLVDLIPDQGLPEETDIDTVHTPDPGLAQGTGHTETEEPSSLHHLYTLTEGWDTIENAKEVRSRWEDP